MSGEAKDLLWALGVTICIFLGLLQAGSILTGVMDVRRSRSDTCEANGKWGYVFPLYEPACRFTEWMNEDP